MAKKITTKEKVNKEKDEEVIVPTAEGAEDEEDVGSEEQEESIDSVDIILSVKDHNVFTDKIFVRTYSRKAHGDDFEKLADEFCTKKPMGKKGIYVKVPADKIPVVEVRYREKEDAEKHIDHQNPNAPIVDKVKVFTDKPAAVRFGSQKYDSTVVVSRRKK